MNGRQQALKRIPEAEESVQMISFTIGPERFGVQILVVQEIIMMSNITEIPNSRISWRASSTLENIIPVLDLRKRLRLRNYPQPDGQKLEPEYWWLR
jgi:purine-binding chemotaxis protein CheW